jgi:hypothetical protein
VRSRSGPGARGMLERIPTVAEGTLGQNGLSAVSGSAKVSDLQSPMLTSRFSEP